MPNHSNYFVHDLLHAHKWQHRREFEDVCAWWRQGGRGVCALVGMGGAGKTAIAERLLLRLPEVMPEHANVAKDPTLPRPQSVFVYSFYRDDKPETFFDHLQFWLEDTSAPGAKKSPTQLMFDIQRHHGLMILDGLEKVQLSGVRGDFGRLVSSSLRDLLNHIACGSARHLSVLATSRFLLADLSERQPPFFHTIAVEEIDVAAGVALLRARGVRGPDSDLKVLVELCGRHALTVDLAGGYIHEFGDGDPATPLNLATADEPDAKETAPAPINGPVLRQSKRFRSLAEQYRQAITASDPAMLALLERICLFRFGVDRKMLVTVFTGPHAETISGKPLAELNTAGLQKKLDWLLTMGLIDKVESETVTGKPRITHTVHPAVREGFLSWLSAEASATCHEAIRRGLAVSLGEENKATPTPAALDLIEEIIFHTLAAGRFRDAWSLYVDRLRGYHVLGSELGNYDRGLRICRMFLYNNQHAASGERELPDSLRSQVLNQAGLFASRWVSSNSHPNASLPRFQSNSEIPPSTMRPLPPPTELTP